VAGGTQLAATRDPALKFLVDITACGLQHIEDHDGDMHIGACVTLDDLHRSALPADFAGGIVAQTAGWTGSRQLRHSATVGGTIMTWGDLALAFLALDAQVVITGNGERRLALADFCAQRETALLPGELIKECVLPAEWREAAGCALRLSRTRQDHALVSVAAVMSVANGICRNARLAVQPVKSGIIRIPEAEALLEGHQLTSDLLPRVAEAAMTHVQPRDDFRASAEYRRKMIGVYTKRALQACLK
jgi:carbon-monoxide dehydrogenase medium subunit